MQGASEELIGLLSGARTETAYLRVKFGVVDPTVVPAATITASSQEKFSYVRDIITGVDLYNDYQTFEPGSWILGRGGDTLPVSDWKKTGLTSSEISNADGLFEVNPTITVISTKIHSIIGITIDFDEFRNNWCNYIIRAYLGNTLVAEHEVSPSNYQSVMEIPIDDWNRLEFIFTKTSVPYRRLRITSLLFGIIRVDEHFFGAKQIREYSPISDKLPTETLTWTIGNHNHDFRPGQSQGIQKYYMEQQPVDYDWGYPLSDGTIERIKGGSLLTTGQLTFPHNLVTIKATSLLNYMTDEYLKGVFSPNGTSLYSLAEDVLIDADLPLSRDGGVRWKLWEGLKDLYSVAPLPRLTGKALLQIIANCGGCVFKPDRDGFINIEPISTVQHDMKIDYGVQTSWALPTDNPPLYSVTVGVGSYVLESTTEIHRSNQTFVGIRTIEVNYAESHNITTIVTGGSIITEQTNYYATYATITISGNGSVGIIIRGNPLKRTNWTHEKIYGLNGEILPTENILCTNQDTAEIIAKTIGEFYSKRSIYSANYNGNPLIDPLDRIWVENDFEYSVSGLIIGHELEYNGAWKGKLKWSN